MKYAKLSLLSAAIVAVSANAENIELPTLNVVSSPLVNSQTLNSSRVSQEELKTLVPTTSDTASLLGNIPGLNIQGAGGVSGLPVIHGLADDRLRIKVDGMDLISACGNHMNPALSYIDPSNVGSAKVFAGISPVSFGGDSIGGAIIVNSAAAQFAKSNEGLLTTGELGAFYRSNGNVQGGNISATIASDSLSLSYQGSTVESDNYDAGGSFKAAGLAAAGRGWLSSDEVGSSMYKSTNESVSLAWRNDDHLVELTYGEQDIPYQGWTNQRMDMTGNDSKQLNLSYEGEYDWGTVEARVYREKTRHAMQFGDDKLFWYGPNSTAPATDGIACTPTNLPSPPEGCAAGMPMDTEGKNTGATIKAEIPLSEQDVLRVGVELQEYRLDDWWDASGKGMAPNTFLNIYNGERDRIAVFAEWDAQWSSMWTTQMGIRGERVDMDAGEVQGYNGMYDAEAATFNAADRSVTDNNIDLTLLARYTPSDTYTIEFGYGRKTRSANLYERYTWSTGGMAMRMINMAGDGNGYVGNLELNQEIAHTASATFDWHDSTQKKWGLQVTPYYTYADDYIDAARCGGGVGYSSCKSANLTGTDKFVYLQFVNQSARLYGIDVSGYLPLVESSNYGRFTATGILNYVRGKNKSTGDNLYNMMPLNVKLAVVQSLDNWTNTVEVELVDDKTNVSDTRNEVKTSSYGIMNLRSSYKWKKVSVNVGVENLFDKFYNDPLGGVYFGQGKTMSGTGVDWGLSVPGMGRSIYAGVNYQF